MKFFVIFLFYNFVEGQKSKMMMSSTETMTIAEKRSKMQPKKNQSPTVDYTPSVAPSDVPSLVPTEDPTHVRKENNCPNCLNRTCKVP